MKKRIISLILAVLIVAGMAPFSAFADSGAKLQFSWSWENSPQDSMDIAVGNAPSVKFYFTENGNSEAVTENITFPSFLAGKYDADNGLWNIQATDVGNGDITYSKNGVDYTLQVTSSLPALGLYSSTDIKAENIIPRNCFTLSKNQDTFYAALSPAVFNNGNGFTLEAVNEKLGEEITDANIKDVADVVISQDKSYATVTVTNTAAQGGYQIEFTVKNTSYAGTQTMGCSILIENDMPRLYFCQAGSNNDAGNTWTVYTEWAQESVVLNPGNDITGCFYYGSRTAVEKGNVAPIDPEDLTYLPSYLEKKDASEYGCNVENAVTLLATRLRNSGESGNITYASSDGAVTFPFDSVLPDIGFYSEAPAADAATLIYDGNPFTVTESERTVYLCSADPVNIRITGIKQWDDNGYNHNDIFTVDENCTDSNGNKYISFTVIDGKTVPAAGISLEINAEWSNGNGGYNSSTYYVMLCLKNGVPTLMLRYAEYDDTTATWVESQNELLRYSLTLNKGNTAYCNFYYGTEDECTPVDFEDLNLPSNIFCADEDNGVVRIYGTGYEESGDITYTDVTDKKTVTLPVTVNQPSLGLYSAQTADENTYLGENVDISSTNDTFYLIFNEDDFKGENWEIISIMSQTNGDNVTNNFDIRNVTDYCIAISPKNGSMPAGGSYTITVSCGDQGDWIFFFNLNRTDLSEKLNTPTNLQWHINYDSVSDGTRGPSYAIRNGIISFTAKDSQNRFSVEVYSSADGYKVPVLIISESSYGDTDSSIYFSDNIFIWSDMPSGTYKFRVRALGDGTQYSNSEWSELSEEWTYVRPAQRLTAPDSGTFGWAKDDGMYWATWQQTSDIAVGSYDIEWSAEDKDGCKELLMNNGIFGFSGSTVRDAMADFIQTQSGGRKIIFRVRAVPEDITLYRMSPYSSFSKAFNTDDVVVSVNSKLDDATTEVNKIIDNPSSTDDPVASVQSALAGSTAELYTAMSADAGAEIAKEDSTGTLDKIKTLESILKDNNNVKTDIKAEDDAPQAVKSIAGDITMVGAALNANTKNVKTGETPTVALVLDKPDEGAVISTQVENTVQFSMELSGGVDSDDSTDGRQLVVPIVLDMPVPEGINPDFLVILHRHSNEDIEQIFPYKYVDDNGRTHAVFTVKSFSTFAFVEYSLAFDKDSVTKYLGCEPFKIEAAGTASVGTVTYTSSNTSIAEVESDTGLVTVLKPGEVTITAAVEATNLFPQTEASYTLTVRESAAYVPLIPAAKEQSSKDTEGTDKKEFSDVKSDTYYTEAVGWAVEKSITAGTGDGTTFSPNKTCTRAEMVTFLYRLAGKPEVKALTAFTDVDTDAYYAEAVAWAVEKGITTGTGDGTTFSPDKTCTRAEMVTFLYRLAGEPEVKALPAFTDVESGAYYAEAVAWAVENGITAGTGDGTTFSPNKTCTRAETVTFLYRYDGKYSNI